MLRTSDGVFADHLRHFGRQDESQSFARCNRAHTAGFAVKMSKKVHGGARANGVPDESLEGSRGPPAPNWCGIARCLPRASRLPVCRSRTAPALGRLSSEDRNRLAASAGIDQLSDRLEIAQAQGAETIDFGREDPIEVLKGLTGGAGVDRVIDAVGVDAQRPHSGPAAAKADEQADEFEREQRQVANEQRPTDRSGGPGTDLRRSAVGRSKAWRKPARCQSSACTRQKCRASRSVRR